jgi:hypothetical protein
MKKLWNIFGMFVVLSFAAAPLLAQTTEQSTNAPAAVSQTGALPRAHRRALRGSSNSLRDGSPPRETAK